jgi:hypothetical protein
LEEGLYSNLGRASSQSIKEFFKNQGQVKEVKGIGFVGKNLDLELLSDLGGWKKMEVYKKGLISLTSWGIISQMQYKFHEIMGLLILHNFPFIKIRTSNVQDND